MLLNIKFVFGNKRVCSQKHNCVCLTVCYILNNQKTTCFGLQWPSTGFSHPKQLRLFYIIRVTACWWDLDIPSWGPSFALSFDITRLHLYVLFKWFTHTPSIGVLCSSWVWCRDLFINTPSRELYRIILIDSNEKRLMMATAGRNM